MAIQDALRVPLKAIQERLGHALTGSFTLDVYGGQPEWERNLEAARLVGAELQKAVQEATEKMANEASEDREAEFVDGLTPIRTKGSGASIS